MKQTQEQIEKLKSLRESLDWAIDLAENQLPELKSALLEVKDKIDNIKLPEIDTTELASKDLERFWDVVPEDSEEIISEEDIHAAVEDIWTQTFNS